MKDKKLSVYDNILEITRREKKRNGMKNMENMEDVMEDMKGKGKKMNPEQEEMVIPASDLSSVFFDVCSSLYVLGVKLKNFHWNMIGDQFFPAHAMLDCQISSVFDFADGAAELVRQIDSEAVAPISMQVMIDNSVIDEETDEDLLTAEDIFSQLSSDYKAIMNQCQEAMEICDKQERQDLSDFVINVKNFLSKYKWQFDSAIK